MARRRTQGAPGHKLGCRHSPSPWRQGTPPGITRGNATLLLVHNAEIVHIEGESYRLKEAKERSEKRRKQRAARKRKSRTKPGTDD